jgi:flagellar hook-associated protein 2
MTGITASGVGSGLDVNSIVSQLVAAERAPADGRLDRSSRTVNAQISAIGSLRSAFSTLRTSLEALSSDATLNARKATAPSDANFTASSGPTAATGNYQIEVLALATAQKLSSKAYTNADAIVGTGQLTLVTGDTTLVVDIDAEHASLGDIRDAINAKAAGKGVAATLVQADDGAHLVLTALDTGTANAITVTTSGGDGGLAAIAYDPAHANTQLGELSAATDAVVKADGYLRTSASNTVTDLVGGVTITLTKAAPGTVQQLTVNADQAAQKTAIKSFVSAYNASVNTIAGTTAYNATTKVAAALNGDPLVLSASRALRDTVSGQVGDLKAIGVTINKDGTLAFDEAAFAAAMASDPSPSARLFGGDASLAKALDATLDGLLDDDGQLDGRADALAARTKRIESDRTALDRRMDAFEQRTRAQFVALDGLVAKLQSTGNFLIQQLGLSG